MQAPSTCFKWPTILLNWNHVTKEQVKLQKKYSKIYTVFKGTKIGKWKQCVTSRISLNWGSLCRGLTVLELITYGVLIMFIKAMFSYIPLLPICETQCLGCESNRALWKPCSKCCCRNLSLHAFRSEQVWLHLQHGMPYAYRKSPRIIRTRI